MSKNILDPFNRIFSLTTTIMNQSQSTLIGDSFVSMSHLPNQTVLQQNGNEEPLLELWLAQLGYEQAESLRESIVPSSPSQKVRLSQDNHSILAVFRKSKLWKRHF